MIKPEQIPIPSEARIAATTALAQTGGCVVSAIRAAINAWPGARSDSLLNEYALTADPVVILPLPKAPQERISTENSDE